MLSSNKNNLKRSFSSGRFIFLTSAVLSLVLNLTVFNVFPRQGNWQEAELLEIALPSWEAFFLGQIKVWQNRKHCHYKAVLPTGGVSCLAKVCLMVQERNAEKINQQEMLIYSHIFLLSRTNVQVSLFAEGFSSLRAPWYSHPHSCSSGLSLPLFSSPWSPQFPWNFVVCFSEGMEVNWFNFLRYIR